MRILFITSTRLGDAILSTGILNALAQAHPQAKFTIACGEVAAGVFESFPQREATHIMIKKKYDLHWVGLWAKCISYKWDMIVDIRGSVISFLLWAHKRIVIKGGRRAGLRITYLGEAMGMKPPPLPTIWLHPEEKAQARSLLPSTTLWIGLGPTANWGGKIWPAENFVTLYKKLKNILIEQGSYCADSIRPVIFYGPGMQEKERARAVLEALPDACDRGGKYTIGEVAAFLQQCRLFIGNDSGLMHLSAATHTPTLGLFGPSKVEEYAPTGEWASFVVAPGENGQAPIQDLSVESAFEEARLVLKRTESLFEERVKTVEIIQKNG